MILYCENKNVKKNGPSFEKYGVSKASDVRQFHKKLKGYSETALVNLEEYAAEYGVKNIFIKDESSRFNLNAFKALGGSYAINEIIKDNKGIDTVITATDGNHGRGVAWSAQNLGIKSVVYMPKGTAKERLDNILSLGADASILNMNYDDCVRKAKSDADKYGWTLVQDTAFEGYEEIPEKIMQGYTTMALEAYEQMNKICPTHIFLQAGVGSMAAAVAAFFSDTFKESKPIITIVEPNAADCFYKTATSDDGRLHSCTGDMNTIMAGLACGEPCTIAWDILKECADFFVSVSDECAMKGMRKLAEHKIISGESGASAFGFFCSIMENPNFEDLKNKLGIDDKSVLLFFSTEGATDRENYRKIVGEI